MLVFFIVITSTVAAVSSQRNCQTADNSDPCNLYDKKDIPFIRSRGPSTRYSGATSDINKYCDLHAIDNGIWYISIFNMTNTCVQQESCGSRLPIWLNGSIPSNEDGAVNRSGCVRTFDVCCSSSYELMIKNCIWYNVYCFWQLPNGCHQRYCFDVDESKLPPTTTTTTTTTPMPTTSRDNQITTSKSHVSSAGKGDLDSDKQVIIGLSATLAVAVSAVVLLAGFIVVLKKKLATSVLPGAFGEKAGVL